MAYWKEINEYVSYELSEETLRIRMDCPCEGGIISSALLQGLASTMKMASEQPELRCICISGNDKTFLAGYCEDSDSALADFWNAFEELKVPVILEIKGRCFSFGMELLLASDLALASVDARFGCSDICDNQLSVDRLASMQGVLPSKAMFDMLYCGEELKASRLLEMGILNEVCHAEELETRTSDYVRRLVAQPRQIIAFGREAYHKMAALPKAERSAYGSSIQGTIMDLQARLNHEDMLAGKGITR